MEEKFKSTLIGLAIGDAMGGPLEFMSKNQIQIKHGEVREMIGGGWLNLRPGEFTDDTEMMMELSYSIVERRGFEPEDVAKRYVEWLKKNPKDVGNITRSSLSLIEQGANLDDASKRAQDLSKGKSAGNGTVMRCAPLGLLFYDDYEKLIENSLIEARITHYDIKAGSGSAAVNLIIAELIKGETEKGEIFDKVFDILEENKQGAVNILPDFESKSLTDLRPETYVVDTLECAIWCFFKTKTFEDCITTAVNLGGDADTIGAIAGAFAGAHYGLKKIPKKWYRALHDRSVILQLARDIFAFKKEKGEE